MSNKRNVIIIGVLIVLIAAVFIYAFKPFSRNKQQPVLRNLSEEQKKGYQDKISQNEETVKNTSPNTPADKQALVQAYISLGQQYYGLGKLGDSKDSFEKALKLDPKNESALVALSLTLSEQGDFKGAKTQLDEAIKNNSSNPDLWLRVVDIQTQAGAGSAEITDLYKKALSETSMSINVLTRYATFLEAQHNYSEAALMWDEAAKVYPANAAVYNQEAQRLKALSK